MEYSDTKINTQKPYRNYVSMNKINGGVVSISDNNFCNAERNEEVVDCRATYILSRV